MTWYNKYRPLSFDDVVGQDLVKQVLQNSLVQGKIKHSYLLTGPKGTGKTTMARIFANSLNETNLNPQASLDIIEMDAASNTGIDDIRFLTEVAQVPPIAGKYKIYIIDEVHMLSKNAMNALLKILEEPPKYLIFLLATTNPEKLLPTVMSRLTKLSLSSHTIEGLVGRLRYIADLEKISITDQALNIIAGMSSGGQRDAINHLETVASFDLEAYEANNVSELLGLVNQVLIQDIIDSLIEQSINTTLTKQLANLGVDGQVFLGQVFEYVLDKSLDGDSRYDDLINPLAQVISYQLPTLTPLTALAILQSKLGLRVFQKVPTTTSSEPVQNIKKKPESLPELMLEIRQPQSQKVRADFEPIVPVIEDVPMETEELTTTAITVTLAQKFFQELNKLTTTPPTLKMCLQDVQVASINQEIVNLTISNGFFLGLINNPINQKFLRKELESRFGIGLVMSFTIRDNQNSVNVQVSTVEVQLPEPIQPMPIPKPISKPSSQEPAGEVFYEAYRSLKPGMEDKGIRIHSPSIGLTPSPTSANTDLDMFDDLISDLDLE